MCIRDRLICCTETPFKFQDSFYLQKDGVAMGSPLDPTFADFYMAELENGILRENNTFNPVFYVRYVDDTLTIFRNHTDIHQFINRLQSLSCLKFTSETSLNNIINFLDIKIKINDDGTFSTGIHVKPTDNGLYLNYSSYSPEVYKNSIVKTLIYRAYKYCSDWESFDVEVQRIKQNLINCNHPLNLTEKIINKTINKLYKKQDNTNNISESIKFYFKTSNAKDFDKRKNAYSALLTPTLNI